ncbi:restriction endonuclease subunit S [Rhodococcus qingshengii]|jgi:type I restriction enzyme S subunit|uniref:restriction endonuclease subunit S n=1 Tax=Rhodococcus qingshengii TaxID=334542 RepID=UPI000E529EAB|nr:restriction endonuclease subunit S [Rhodococcus qingshengii]RGP47908.1 hypothetical protein AWH04_25105 [Rhodococcus erythropolis]THJ65338.1 hypothetical protein EU244_30060 [Rhodococcus qingshengii]
MDRQLPTGWAWATLGELTENLDRQRKPISATVRASRPGSIPYYGASGQVGTIDEALFDDELLLLGEDGVQFFDPNKTKAYLIQGKSWVNNHAHVLRAGPATLNRFLLHYLNQFNYEGFANGTTRLKLTKLAASSIPVILPPLPEQHRIVEVLEDHFSRLDAADAALSSQLDRLRGIVDRQLRVTLQNSNVKTERVSKLLLRKPANGRSVPTADVGFPVLRLTSLRDGTIDIAQRKIGEWSASDAEKYLVHQGDILLSRGNGSLRLVGRAGIVRDEPDPVAYPDTMIRLTPNTELILPNFLVAVWNSRIVRDQIEAAARTTAGIYKISQSIVSDVEIPIASLAVQQQIVNEITDVADAVRRISLQIERTRIRTASLRQSLLRCAFNGDLVDQNHATEPAEIVLARSHSETPTKTAHGRKKSVAAR